jgi:CDP-diacylglycerol--glycerol-3-phosphate 3-phosphatidyltransferase
MLMQQWFLVSFIVFVLASLSDFFDGWLAKKYNATSKIGGVLDHIGDKLLVANGLIMIMMFLQIWWIIIPAAVMICRELYISGLREFMGTQKIEMPVPHARMSMGKVKAALQMVALSVLFLWGYLVNADVLSAMLPAMGAVTLIRWILYGGIALLWLSTVASVWSAATYTKDFLQKLKKIK